MFEHRYVFWLPIPRMNLGDFVKGPITAQVLRDVRGWTSWFKQLSRGAKYSCVAALPFRPEGML